jgi:hypothetical protein
MTSSSSTASTSDLGTSAVPASLRCLTTARDVTNGAPCLGLAIMAAGALWAGLGSTLALLLT